MSYPKELKIALVREYEQGKTVAEISKTRGVPENSIYRWIREYQTINAGSYSFTPSDFNKLQKHSKKADHVLEIISLSGFISVLPLKKDWQRRKPFIAGTRNTVFMRSVMRWILTAARFITTSFADGIPVGGMKKNTI